MPHNAASGGDSRVPVFTTGNRCPALCFEDNNDLSSRPAAPELRIRLDDALNAIPESLIIGHLVRARGWRHDGICCLRRGWGARG
jgi:hypothetical protein